jgi:nitrile hydratase subunit beta
MAEAESAPQRFSLGDRVRVLDDVPAGNPRTPHYLRGRTGQVVAFHGIVVNPLDHRQPYPPLYSVVFSMPDDQGAEDEVLADIHEEWLVAVP